MTPEILLTNDDTLSYEDGGAGGTATGVGALRHRDGKFAGTSAALIEEGTTNLVPDPCATRETSWGQFGNTLDLAPSIMRNGTPSMKVSYVSGSRSCIQPFGITGGASYHGEIYLRAAQPGQTASVQMRFEAGGVGKGAFETPYLPLDTSAWTLFDVPGLTADNADDGLRIWIMFGPERSAGHAIWAVQPQVEAKDHATTPCPELDASGTLMPGYAWTGTAHNSASTRAAASITIPFAGTVGSLACWYSEDMGQTWSWHYAESLGSIGTYGDIADDGGGNLVVTSDRALLLGPLAVWSDTLTLGEQAGMQALGSMWTWADVEQVTVTLDTAMTATGTSTATAGTALTLGTAASAAGTSTATMDTTLLAYLDIAATAAGTSTATASTALTMRTALASAGTSFAELRPEPPPVPLGTTLGTVGYTARPGVTVTSTLRPAPIAAGYTPRETPIAAGYVPRPPSED